MNKIRCFLAIKLDNLGQYSDKITSISADIDVNIKIVNPQNYHFTLHFFGDLDEIEINRAHGILKSLKFQKFKIIMKNPGSLPKNKINETRVLYIEPSDGNKKIIKMISEIRQTLTQANYKIDKRKALPHLTVCRVRRGQEIGKLTRRWLVSDFASVEIECSTLLFLKSELTPLGSHYSTMFEYPLNETH